MSKHLSKIALTLALTTAAVASTYALATNTSNLATQSSAPSATLTLEQASHLALKAQPGSLKEIDQDVENGRAVFEVEVATADGNVELILDANSGEVLALRADDDHDDDYEDDHTEGDDA